MQKVTATLAKQTAITAFKKWCQNPANDAERKRVLQTPHQKGRYQVTTHNSSIRIIYGTPTCKLKVYTENVNTGHINGPYMIDISMAEYNELEKLYTKE